MKLGFVSGHDFSRAVTAENIEGFKPLGVLFLVRSPPAKPTREGLNYPWALYQGTTLVGP
jgi:hypothetical protein